MLPEYDLSRAVRGKFAGLTGDQRATLSRESRTATVRAWADFAAERVHRLEAALFTYLVLGPSARPSAVRDESLLCARSTMRLEEFAKDVGADPVLDDTHKRRFRSLVDEARWMAHGDPGEIEGSPTDRLAHVERLERLGREADALRAVLRERVEQHLEAGGLSRREIERKTEETAKLWRAA